MTKDYKALTADITEYIRELKKVVPEPMEGFYKMAGAAKADGALDKKTKEFAALAIAITQRCDGCIGFHTKELKELGATREEVAEIIAMCVYMGGGPALMYAAEALRAFDQFSE